MMLLGVALAASPTQDLVRLGNDAFEARNYADAVELYRRAEVDTTDPGLVAYNMATAYYQMALAAKSSGASLFQQAESHYRCASEGDGGMRRRRALFGLGNSLMQGRSDEIRAVKEAIACYEELLKVPDLEEPMAGDVRHNLTLAKATLQRLQAKAETEKPPGVDNPDDPGNRSKDPDEDPDRKQGEPGTAQGPKKERPTQKDGTQAKDGKDATKTDERQAGAGKEKPLDDNSTSPPLSAAKADEDLDAAVRAILKQQTEMRLRSRREVEGPLKDW
jgi:hypothetical protein